MSQFPSMRYVDVAILTVYRNSYQHFRIYKSDMSDQIEDATFYDRISQWNMDQSKIEQNAKL